MSPYWSPPGSESLGGQPTNSRCPGATSTQGGLELVSVNMDDVTIGGFPFSAEKSTFPPPGFNFGEMTGDNLQAAMDAAFPGSQALNEAFTGLIHDTTDSTTAAFEEFGAWINDGVIPDLGSGFSQALSLAAEIWGALEDGVDYGDTVIEGVFQDIADVMGGEVATNLSMGQWYEGSIWLRFRMNYEQTFWEERIRTGWEVDNTPICVIARVQGSLEFDAKVDAEGFFSALKGDLSADLGFNVPLGTVDLVVGAGVAVDMEGDTSTGAVFYFDV